MQDRYGMYIWVTLAQWVSWASKQPKKLMNEWMDEQTWNVASHHSFDSES